SFSTWIWWPLYVPGMACIWAFAAASSLEKEMPVSQPISLRVHTTSSVDRFPEAPGAKGQPPRPPRAACTLVTPISMAARVLAMPRPRVSWKWTIRSRPGYAFFTAPITARTWAGSAMPIVSHRQQVFIPAST
ncbi:Zinc ribbon domain-containing protein, partial [Dysosmobacter welbionis]